MTNLQIGLCCIHMTSSLRFTEIHYEWPDQNNVAVCSFVCLFFVCLLVCRSVCLSVCLSVGLSVCLSVCRAVCLSVGLSACLSVGRSVCRSVCLFVCLFVFIFLAITFCYLSLQDTFQLRKFKIICLLRPAVKCALLLKNIQQILRWC